MTPRRTMKVWVVTEDLITNDDPEVVGVFSNLDACSKGIKNYVARLYGTAEEAEDEIRSFDATLYTVDEKADDRPSPPVEGKYVVFSTRGCVQEPPEKCGA